MTQDEAVNAILNRYKDDRGWQGTITIDGVNYTDRFDTDRWTEMHRELATRFGRVTLTVDYSQS